MSPFAPGMGLSGDAAEMLRRELRPVPLDRLIAAGSAGALGHDEGPVDPNCGNVAVRIQSSAFACSEATFAFLQNNVLRTNDITPVLLSGFVRFDGSLGVHEIPLGIVNDAKNVTPGSYFVPDTQALIVTGFVPFAGMANPGLPGAHVSIDPLSLVGQVAFYLVAENGVHVLGENTVTQGENASGTEIVNSALDPSSASPFTDITRVSIQAMYKVFHKPFPGYPGIVGVRLSGYLIDQTLLDEALQNRSYRTEG